MTHMKTVYFSTSPRANRVLVFASMMIVTVCMFGLAYTAHAATLTRQLSAGMSGSDVSALQAFLARDPSIYPQGLVTGFYGPLTTAAVSKFQTRNGIASVGRVGPITLALINSVMGSVVTNNIAPIIGPVSVNSTSTGATLNWNTTVNTSGIVYYSTSPLPMTEASANTGVVIGGTSLLANSDLLSTHSAMLTGLSANTTYYYVVYSRDSSGNENITWPSTFKTNQ